MCKENDNLKAQCSFSWSVSFLPAFKSVLGLCNTHRMESLLTYLLCKDTNFPTDFSYIRRSLGTKPYPSFSFPCPLAPCLVELVKQIVSMTLNILFTYFEKKQGCKMMFFQVLHYRKESCQSRFCIIFLRLPIYECTDNQNIKARQNDF